jgi:hypothetical protein
MALNFDSLPKERPNNNSNVEAGKHEATVFKAEMRESKAGNPYLNVSFKTAQGFVNEGYMESDKEFILWKIGQLLKACNVKLEGEGSLKDISKVIVGKKVMIDVVLNDKGYPTIDYSGNNEGVAPIGNTTEVVEETSDEIDPDVATVLNTEFDEEF